MKTIALKTAIPGPVSQQLMLRRKSAVAQGPFHVTPIFLSHAEGAAVTDVDGNVLLDFSGGLGTLNVGHNNPAVVDAVRAQAGRLIHSCFHVALYEPYVALAEKLNAIAPGATKAQLASLEDIIAILTQDLERANAELKGLDRTKTNFFSVINHEMRTPLTAVMGYTELLQFRGDAMSPDDRNRMLDSVKGSSQRLLELVNNILDIARIEDGKMTLVQDIMELPPAVDQALAVVQPMASKKNIEIRTDLEPDIPYLWGDSKRVNQILINLLSNAVKYTPDTGRVAITAGPSAKGDMVEISVADTGIGIPADQLPFIFDRFSRVERSEIGWYCIGRSQDEDFRHNASLLKIGECQFDDLGSDIRFDEGGNGK